MCYQDKHIVLSSFDLGEDQIIFYGKLIAQLIQMDSHTLFHNIALSLGVFQPYKIMTLLLVIYLRIKSSPKLLQKCEK